MQARKMQLNKQELHNVQRESMSINDYHMKVKKIADAHKCERKQCSLFLACTKKNEDQVQILALLYNGLLKGGSTLTLALPFMPSTYPCWPT